MNYRGLSILTTMIVTFGLAAMLAPRAWAHPGHGLDTTGVGLLHFLLQPSHGGIALVAAVAFAAFVALRKRRRHG
jgi:MYXO-CTERM domain-containing protein